MSTEDREAVEAMERLREAIAGDRFDWDRVLVRPDDIAALLAHKVRDAIPPATSNTTIRADYSIEDAAMAECDHSGEPAVFCGDCGSPLVRDAIPAEPLDVERLRAAYHVEFTSGDNECYHGNRWECRDRAEETVHWDRLAALRPDPEPEG